MPLEFCQNARASRSEMCRDVEYDLPSKGYFASQKSFYFGYKLHGICSISGVIQSIGVAPASVHDIHMLKDVKMTYSKCTLLGAMGCLSADIQ